MPVGAGGYDYRIIVSKAKKWVPVGAGPFKVISYDLQIVGASGFWTL